MGLEGKDIVCAVRKEGNSHCGEKKVGEGGSRRFECPNHRNNNSDGHVVLRRKARETLGRSKRAGIEFAVCGRKALPNCSKATILRTGQYMRHSIVGEITGEPKSWL